MLLWCLFAGVSCGEGGGSGSSPQTPVPASQPTFAHVAVVVLENHSYSEVIGNSSMPYLNGLAEQYGLAALYYANQHPSLPNYFMLTTGKTETIDDNFSATVSDDNLARELNKAGKSWKCYAQALPSAGYMGEDVYPFCPAAQPLYLFLGSSKQRSSGGESSPFLPVQR